MKQILHKSWWGILILSLLIAGTGIYLVLKPGTSMITLLQAMGVFLFVSGAIMIFIFYNRRRKTGGGFWFGEGILNLLVGIFFFFFPDLLITLVFILLGIWVVFISLLFLLVYFKLKNNIFFLISGLILLVSGFALVFNPVESAELSMQIIGIILTISGIFTFISAINLKKIVTKSTGETIIIN